MLSAIKPPTHHPSPNRLRSRDRQATEEALIGAASELFSRNGYEATTTRSIAEQAGCSEVLIQRYFNGKEGLLLAVLRQEDNESILEFLRRPLCANLAEEAREMFAFALESLEKKSDKLRIVHSRVLVDSSFKADFNRLSLRNEFKSEAEARFARYKEAGMLSPDLEVQSVTEMLLGLCFELGFTHREFLDTSPARLQQLSENFAELFARAVSARRQEQRPSSA